MKTAILRMLFASGALLLMLNIVGMFIPLRNEAIYEQAGFTTRPTYITLAPEEVLSVIQQDASNDRKAYLVRLTGALNKGVLHYWEDDGIDKYSMRVPIYENYLLYAASHLYPRLFQKYEFMDYRRAVARGVGLCSQYSLIISQVLEDKGIPVKIINFDGHVVATAQADPHTDEWWILDADYGVVTPHDIRAVERNPGLGRAAYIARGYLPDELNVAGLLKKGYRIVDGARGYAPTLYWVEYVAYVLIWLIPAVLMMPMVCSLLAGFHRARWRASAATAPRAARTGAPLERANLNGRFGPQ
jgi:hypothetical protein